MIVMDMSQTFAIYGDATLGPRPILQRHNKMAAKNRGARMPAVHVPVCTTEHDCTLGHKTEGQVSTVITAPK